MTVCLELHREARRRGPRRPCSCPPARPGSPSPGWGIAVDQVVSDFVAGAAEQLVVEGQAARRRRAPSSGSRARGRSTTPYYSGVTLGLLHGSAPHAMVFVHEPGRELIEGDPRYPIGSLSELIDDQVRMARHVRPAPVVAVALKTNRIERGRGARGDRPDRARDWASWPTTRSGSGPGGSSTRCSRPAEPAIGFAIRAGARPPTDHPGGRPLPLLPRRWARGTPSSSTGRPSPSRSFVEMVRKVTELGAPPDGAHAARARAGRLPGKRE